jgi:3-oxoacyl-[acyl-carrier-protein] synthase-3
LFSILSANLVEKSDRWIRSRTGIAERPFVAPGECNSDLSARAIQNLLSNRGIDAVKQAASEVEKSLGSTLPRKWSRLSIN